MCGERLSVVFPEKHCIQYLKLNAAGVMKKLQEFNACLTAATPQDATVYLLSEDDFCVLRALLEVRVAGWDDR